MYKCLVCGKEFSHEEFTTVKYQEYPGASFQEEDVCPDCGAPSYKWEDIGNKKDAKNA